jgi:hypothetical protein
MTEMSLCTRVKNGTKLAMAAKHSLQRSLRESDLTGWSLRERILAVLDSCQEQTPPGKRDRHGLRTPERRSYLGLYLVGLFNPVVASMRGLCAAKHLPRVRTLLGRETPWGPSRFSDRPRLDQLRRTCSRIQRERQKLARSTAKRREA